MKKTTGALILFAFFIAAIGCKKSDNNTDNTNNTTVNPDSTGLMTCNISGYGSFRAIDVTALPQNDTTLTINGNLNDDAHRAISIGILNFSSSPLPFSETYHLTDTPYAKINMGIARVGNNSYGSYGTVTITGFSSVITGTFSFTCTDSTKVTGGSFQAKRIE